MYYIYMLRCEDNSIYTGITTDLERRMEEHFNKEKQCAKYTYYHNAKKLENAWTTDTRSLASKLEYYIKHLTKQQKEEIIQDINVFERLLSEKVDCTQYKNWKNVKNEKLKKKKRKKV